jgi:hypothetical protein
MEKACHVTVAPNDGIESAPLPHGFNSISHPDESDFIVPSIQEMPPPTNWWTQVIPEDFLDSRTFGPPLGKADNCSEFEVQWNRPSAEPHITGYRGLGS